MNAHRTVALRAARRCCVFAGLSIIAWFCGTAGFAITPLLSIRSISGQTINFEQPGATPNDILSAYQMLEISNASLTTLISGLVGNVDAPISNRTLFGSSLYIETTGLPWNAIGITGAASSPGQSRFLTITAYDVNGRQMGTDPSIFSPTDNSPLAFNAAAVFLGFSSTQPIGAIRLTSNNPNTAWDNLTFSVVPEPSSSGLLVMGLAIRLCWCRRYKLGSPARHGRTNCCNVRDGRPHCW
jgi:hypothetical protein